MTAVVNSIAYRGAASRNWRVASGLLVGLLAVLGLLYFDTVRSMVSIWIRSDTYAHGFLILPISVYLVWERREVLANAVPEPTLAAVWLMLPVGAIWLLGHLVDALVVQQYAYVLLSILAIWAMLGSALSRFLAFPIGFLLFAVPVGEGLISPLMNFTADFTVGMLRLTGVPVYRDGTFFSIPTGDWSVVEACSGLRYLLASVTLGALYAYLTYTKLWKRLLFFGLAIVVPILANGMRAYLIVMIAHLSDMRFATGVDHLIYGWVFFGVVVAIMFAVGAIWRDPPSEEVSGLSLRGATHSTRKAWTVGFAALVAGGLWSGVGWVLDRPGAWPEDAVVLHTPSPVGDWRPESTGLWDWRPHTKGVDGDIYRFYRSARGPVGLYLGVYRSQREGEELINSANQMVLQGEALWSDKEMASRSRIAGSPSATVTQHRLSSASGRHLLVWEWYRVGRFATGNSYIAKIAEAANRLVGGRRDGTLIAIAAPYRDDPADAARLLREFLSAMWPSIETELDRAVSSRP
jgi:exosortase A